MPSYAIFVPTSVMYVNECMEPGDQYRGQGMITSATICGAVLGSLLGGFLIDRVGIFMTQTIDFFVCAAGTLIIAIALWKEDYKRENC